MHYELKNLHYVLCIMNLIHYLCSDAYADLPLSLHCAKNRRGRGRGRPRPRKTRFDIL